jgi:hypothetical protein
MDAISRKYEQGVRDALTPILAVMKSDPVINDILSTPAKNQQERYDKLDALEKEGKITPEYKKEVLEKFITWLVARAKSHPVYADEIGWRWKSYNVEYPKTTSSTESKIEPSNMTN